MTMQLSGAVRDARNDAIETAIGASPTLELRTGGMPANCAAATTGTKVAEATLPADFMAASSGGVKAKAGTWEDLSADATGTPGYFRIFQGATCHMQGTVTFTGGGGDMTVDVNGDITAGQQFTVTSFAITDGNA